MTVPAAFVRLSTVCAVAVAAIVAAAPAAAAPALAPATQTVEYRGYALDVPGSWPVVGLDHSPASCVTFSRHALYIGRPGAGESCPTHVVGRTEALLVEPFWAATTTQMAHASVVDAGRLGPRGLVAGAQEVSFSVPSAGVFVTATWNLDPALLWRVLGSAHLTGNARAGGMAAPSAAPRSSVIGNATGSAGAFTGVGFDSCTAPSSSDMSAWRSGSPYTAVGVYIGGVNRGCAQPNLTAGWVATQMAAGWHFIPTYVGLQAPGNGCGCSAISPGNPAGQGALAADDAVAQAGSLGLRSGNPIYYDMESYPTGPATTPVVLSFLSGWTSRLHADGYISGVYSSSSTGISDLVGQFGTPYLEPDDIWTANWNGQQTTTDPWVPTGDWSNQQRLHQYAGGHTESYGGVAINIDGDYLDGSAAPAGFTPPLLAPLPASEPTTAFTVSWAMPPNTPTVTSFSLFIREGQGRWQLWSHLAGTQVTVFGVPGRQYGYYAEGFAADGRSSGGPGAAGATTTVSPSAPITTPFTSMYAVDGYGILHPASSPPLAASATWPNWNIARGLALDSSGRGGVVGDGWGGLHPVGDTTRTTGGAYWSGWDIVRGVALVPGGSAGWQLDGWGGLHPFALGSAAVAHAATGSAYWAGWDIARGLAAFSDGSGGVVVDGWGGLHPFTTDGSPAPAATPTAYWPGWDIARGVSFVPGSTAAAYSGYVLDGWGGIHPFASPGVALPATPVAAYWRGSNVARSVVLVPQLPTEGYTVDNLGGFNPFGGAPAVFTPTYNLSGPTVRTGSAA